MDNENSPNLQIDPADAENNMVMGIIAYILFFIPLLAAKESPFAMYHANQGLTLFLAALIVSVAGSIIPLLGWFIILPLGMLGCLILAIIGIINAVNKKCQPLPLIGKYTLIK